MPVIAAADGSASPYGASFAEYVNRSYFRFADNTATILDQLRTDEHAISLRCEPTEAREKYQEHLYRLPLPEKEFFGNRRTLPGSSETELPQLFEGGDRHDVRNRDRGPSNRQYGN